MKHNKKRNTAFLYEILLREGTKASLEKNFDRLKLIKETIISHFDSNTALGYELSLYKTLLNDLNNQNSDKVFFEVKTRHSLISRKTLFNEQTQLINKINKTFGFEIYNNFIPNYKNLATISQLFNDQMPIKEKLLLEQKFIEENIKSVVSENLKPIDTLVYKTFVKKFNEKYSNLLSEQKDLLTKYISSFADDGLELKIYVNEEVDRLKNKIISSKNKDDIKNDKHLCEKIDKVLDLLNNFKENKVISESMLENLLKTQQFINEVEN